MLDNRAYNLSNVSSSFMIQSLKSIVSFKILEIFTIEAPLCVFLRISHASLDVVQICILLYQSGVTTLMME